MHLFDKGKDDFEKVGLAGFEWSRNAFIRCRKTQNPVYPTWDYLCQAKIYDSFRDLLR